MTPVAICFVIPNRKKPHEYFIVFFERFETSKQTTMTSCGILIWVNFILFGDECSWVRLGLISKIRKIYLIRILYFDKKNMSDAKNWDSCLSVQWFELLFRNTKLTDRHDEYQWGKAMPTVIGWSVWSRDAVVLSKLYAAMVACWVQVTGDEALISCVYMWWQCWRWSDRNIHSSGQHDEADQRHSDD